MNAAFDPVFHPVARLQIGAVLAKVTQAEFAGFVNDAGYRRRELWSDEGWGWREITQTRWASSAAHLYGRTVVSAEAWTWVHSPSFRATPLDLKGEAHEHLLNGVNLLSPTVIDPNAYTPEFKGFLVKLEKA